MKNIAIILIVLCCFGCAEKEPEGIKIIVKNSLDFNRNFETVEIGKTQLSALNSKTYKIIDTETKEEVISQAIDSDEDGILDVLLFQPEISANSEKSFRIIGFDSDENTGIDSTMLRCYSRFVPERTDDYAWENNRVAFRTFGPVAQKMIEDGVKGGTLTSGMDAWLKRVEYPIINKWYKKHTTGKGSYHEDTGEGLDNFHVGVSRGVGGTAVKTDSAYAVSKNFTSWKTITNGPIRTWFILEYETWNANGKAIKETKHIMLDYGQNLSRHIVQIDGTNELAIGITLHKNEGQITTNSNEGWMSYWEPFDGSELGQGIVLKDPRGLIGFDKYVTDKKDQSNLYAQLNVSGITEYYAGFGWEKSGQFSNKEEWNHYLSQFSKCLDNPLIVEFINPAK